jgi:hypothetical protein
MRCADDAVCVARRYPEKPCWEHAVALNYTASAHGVCDDCIVYVAKRNPPLFSEQELAAILGHQKVYGINHRKCPAQVFSSRLRPTVDERRRSARYRIKGQASAVIANLDNSIGCVLDLSHKGLAFSHNCCATRMNQPLEMDIRGIDFALTGIPAQIISDRPLPNSATEHRRCSVRFTTLSMPQQDMLERIIRQYGQACCYDGVCC